MALSELRRQIIEKVVRPEIRNNVLPPTTGIVKQIYPGIMKADVEIQHPWTGELVMLYRIPYLLAPGQARPMPQPGDRVSVVFQGRMVQSGVIVSQVAERYEQTVWLKTEHGDKGAYVPDTL